MTKMASDAWGGRRVSICISLIQQYVTVEKAEDLLLGLEAIREGVRHGVEVACFAEPAFKPFHPQRSVNAKTERASDLQMFVKPSADIG